MIHFRPADHERLGDARWYYYVQHGFEHIEVPWIVPKQISNITKPPGAGDFELTTGEVLVASGEQSFLKLIHDGYLKPGRYSCTTPCFRIEPRVDEGTRIQFMKLELIDTRDVTPENLAWIVEAAKGFFSRYLEVTTMPTPDGVDIVSKRHRIELGSYGFRTHPLVGPWLYATGCAEPRLSYAINMEYK